MRRLVLFDIDGTLLLSSSTGRNAIRAAYAAEFEDLSFFESVRFDGKTDPQIVTELYAAAGVPERATADRIRAVLDSYLEHLAREVVSEPGRIRALPGVVDLLDALDARPDVVVGLLTGNVVRGAALKLGAAGLPVERFAVGAYGSDSAHRPDLPPIAAQRAEGLLGRVPHGHDVVIIGDTPADVTCGASIGARAIGVATGAYPREVLHQAGAHAAFDTLADTGAVLEAIL